MKKLLIKNSTEIFGMANITPKRSGLPVTIWSDYSGVTRQVLHRNTPRIKIEYQGVAISVSIEPEPRILAPKHGRIPTNCAKMLQQGIEYVGRNYDLFLKHFNDVDDSFDDVDLFDALRDRGEFK